MKGAESGERAARPWAKASAGNREPQPGAAVPQVPQIVNFSRAKKRVWAGFKGYTPHFKKAPPGWLVPDEALPPTPHLCTETAEKRTFLVVFRSFSDYFRSLSIKESAVDQARLLCLAPCVGLPPGASHLGVRLDVAVVAEWAEIAG